MTQPTEYEQLSYNSPDGSQTGRSASEKHAFWGKTPVAQMSDAAQATITITWVTISSGFGFQTSDQVVSLIATFKHLQHVLTTLGLWKGSA